MTRALCIDVGGTNLRAGLAEAGDWGAPTPAGYWPTPTSLDDFRRRIGELVNAHAVSRIGIAIPGLASGTRCVWVPNLPYLDGEDLSDLFPRVSIALGNDAHFALLAEAVSGAAKDLSDAILLAIGTGIGSAVLSDGRILRGHSGSATSFGWASADPDDEGDDRHGWLERKASGRALDRIARQAGLLDGAALMDRARSGDDAALALLVGPAAALGTTLSGAVALLGSQAVIACGGVAEGVDVLAPMILPFLSRQLPPHMGQVSVIKGAFGAGASLAGAGFAAHGASLWLEHAS